MGHRMYNFRHPIDPLYSVEFRTPDEEFLDLFWTTDHPNEGPPGCGVALLCIRHRARRIDIRETFTSGRGLHAEEHLINHLWTEDGLRGSVIVEVFQNYSPCGKCARRYCELADDFRKHGVYIKLEIHFVSLYRICHDVESPFDVDWYLTKRVHWLNVKGLKRLSAAGIQLKGFTRETWLELIGRMGVPLHIDFDRQYEQTRANIDSYCRKKLDKVLACPDRKIPVDASYRNNYNNYWYNPAYHCPQYKASNDRFRYGYTQW